MGFSSDNEVCPGRGSIRRKKSFARRSKISVKDKKVANMNSQKLKITPVGIAL